VVPMYLVLLYVPEVVDDIGAITVVGVDDLILV
jgi:hypothetical protein